MNKQTSRIFRSLTSLTAVLSLAALPLMAGAAPTQNATTLVSMQPAAKLIMKQEPPKITARLMDQLTPDNAKIVVSLSQQRAYLMMNGEVVIDTPISSGRSAVVTPTGSFKITAKEASHKSDAYGNFVTANGEVLETGVSAQYDSAPSGAHFVPVPVKWFCAFSGSFGFYAGVLPGYPAAHGGIRLPDDIAQIFFQKVKIGTPVVIAQ